MIGIKSPTAIKYLDQSLRTSGYVGQVKEIVNKIDRCCAAVSKKVNLADIINDPTNLSSLRELFDEEYDVGVQMLLRLSLENYSNNSFTINKDIADIGKLEYLYRAVGGWKNFDTVVSFQYDTEVIKVINPINKNQWLDLGTLSCGAIVTVYLKNKAQPKMRSQEQVALERYEAIFESVQNMAVDLSANPNSRTSEQLSKQHQIVAKKKIRTKPERRKQRANKIDLKKGLAGNMGELIKSLRFVISKIDTFVHAGNAHLILSHVKKFQGQVKMFVVRVDPEEVMLDADCIWGKEIRNGESVLFEFYGNHPPTPEFERELMEKTNKYTQMDKITE